MLDNSCVTQVASIYSSNGIMFDFSVKHDLLVSEDTVVIIIIIITTSSSQ